MMQDFLQPILDEAVKMVTVLLVIALLAVLGMVKRKAANWLNARTTAAERELVHRIAAEAYAMAEAIFLNMGGKQKLQSALRYLSDRLDQHGIHMSADEMRAVIEKAVLDYRTSSSRAAAS